MCSLNRVFVMTKFVITDFDCALLYTILKHFNDDDDNTSFSLQFTFSDLGKNPRAKSQQNNA